VPWERVDAQWQITQAMFIGKYRQFAIDSLFRRIFTKSSATAEGPRDALYY